MPDPEPKREMMSAAAWARDVAYQSSKLFSDTHPQVRLSLREWADLRAAIIRTIASVPRDG